MTKKELINHIRLKETMTWGQATRIVNTIFDKIAEEAAEGHDVYIPKFGRFYRAKVAQKRCKHPETKKYVIIPAHDVILFRMAAELKRKIERKAGK